MGHAAVKFDLFAFKGVIFDLDGVLVDTAKYHYLAWKRLAAELGFDFTEKDNERLKGVSRMASLEILLEVGGITMDNQEKYNCAAKKNSWYVEYLQQLDNSALLPGAAALLPLLKQRGVKRAIGSASKNTPLILQRLGIAPLFDAVVDGNSVSKAKPDPEVFLKAAEALQLPPPDCVVLEDSLAGIQAAHAGRMQAVGIGSPANLPGAEFWAPNLAGLLP
jgi:beta-phosphoglucomutase